MILEAESWSCVPNFRPSRQKENKGGFSCKCYAVAQLSEYIILGRGRGDGMAYSEEFSVHLSCSCETFLYGAHSPNEGKLLNRVYAGVIIYSDFFLLIEVEKKWERALPQLPLPGRRRGGAKAWRTNTCYENFCIVITKKNVFRKRLCGGECTKAVTQRKKRAIYVLWGVPHCGCPLRGRFKKR